MTRSAPGPALAHLPAARSAHLTGRSFFPSVISPPFGHGLSAAFGFAIAACLIAAAVSLLRGRTYAYGDPPAPLHPRRLATTVTQAQGPGRSPGTTGTVGIADHVDWHQVARLVQRGCPPRLALDIVR